MDAGTLAEAFSCRDSAIHEWDIDTLAPGTSGSVTKSRRVDTSTTLGAGSLLATSARVVDDGGRSARAAVTTRMTQSACTRTPPSDDVAIARPRKVPRLLPVGGRPSIRPRCVLRSRCNAPGAPRRERLLAVLVVAAPRLVGRWLWFSSGPAAARRRRPGRRGRRVASPGRSGSSRRRTRTRPPR